MRLFLLARRRIIFPSLALVLTYGRVAGNYAGRVLQVGYAINLPRVTGARLLLSDGGELELTIRLDYFELALPIDVALGPATVIADTEDDAGAQDSWPLELEIYGVAPPPAPIPAPAGPPFTRVQRERVTLPGASVWIDIGATSIRRASLPLRFTVTVGETTRQLRPAPRVRRFADAVPLTLRTGKASLVARYALPPTTVTLTIRPTSTLRMDGQDVEEALLLNLM